MKNDNTHQFLPFFRVSLGLLLILQYAAFRADFSRIFGWQSVIPRDFTNLLVPEWIVTHYRLEQMLGWSPIVFENAFSILYLGFAVLLVAGLFTRFSALCLIFLHMALVKSNILVNYGVDYFISMSLWYLFLFPAGLLQSVDALLFFRKKNLTKRLETLNLYRLGFQIHVALVYFFSGFDKMLGFNWRNGESIWKAMTLPYINLDFGFQFDWLATYPVLPLLIGWSVVLLELGYPLIFIKPFRKWILGATIAMHIGIALSLNLYFFSAIMVIWNITAFFDFKSLNMGKNVVSSSPTPLVTTNILGSGLVRWFIIFYL